MDALQSWFALKNAPGVGHLLFKRLVDRFGDPLGVMSAAPADLMAVEGVSGRVAGAIKQCRLTDAVLREMELAETVGCRIYTLLDPCYPPLLRHIPDPPPYLYVRGELEALENALAVVGSRSATAYGLSMARRLGADLAAFGLPVVSGMARGIDTAAHQGALSAGGVTIAVLGSGLGVVYPPENRKLFDQIIETGAVVSELPVMEAPNAYHFPARNRIIAGMCIGVVVVEAARKSGSLITARLAAEQGREVFAVPGSIHSRKSDGAHNLLKQGARIVTSVRDIVDEFYFLRGRMPEKPGADEAPLSPPTHRGNAGEALTEDEARVLSLLGPYPVHMDELCRRSDMNSGRLAGILLTLELKGKVSQSPGTHFTAIGEKH